MEDPQPQKNFRNLIDPGAGFGAFLGKLGDALVKAIDKPLGYAVNWGRIFSLWPVQFIHSSSWNPLFRLLTGLLSCSTGP